jgi:Na+/melibiose symporter-like transporter
MTAGRFLFWLIAAATVAVFLVMVLWSFPKISAEAGGLTAFDLLPMGYTEAEALAFLTALTEDGRAFYLVVQHRLDLAYPALLALTLVPAFRHLVPPGAVRGALLLFAVLGMGFDYAENWRVAGLLEVPVSEVTREAILRASTSTQLKSLFGALAQIGLVAALIAAGASGLRARR